MSLFSIISIPRYLYGSAHTEKERNTAEHMSRFSCGTATHGENEMKEITSNFDNSLSSIRENKNDGV